MLRHLPMDATLQNYLASCNFPVPAGLDWNDEFSAVRDIITAIETCPDTTARDRVIAGLQTAGQLAHPAAWSAMVQAVGNDAAALTQLAACKGEAHRAFWLLVHHPRLFETACDVDYVDSHVGQSQQIDLGARLPVRREPEAMEAFCAAIQQFYKKELFCGDTVIGHLMDRSGGTQLVTIHAKDLARTLLEFDGERLQRRVGNPTIHMALEYSSRTGVARTLIKGGEKYNRMLGNAFAEHMLDFATCPFCNMDEGPVTLDGTDLVCHCPDCGPVLLFDEDKQAWQIKQGWAAREVRDALDAVGGSCSPAGSALWFVAGMQMTIRDWALRDGWNGKRVEKNEAKGILVAALGVLARYYGYERSGLRLHGRDALAARPSP
ncbi:MAG: hypothetical protein RBR77_07370 [Thauera sp.]|nr:hypothetical protein [Thauera sp.]